MIILGFTIIGVLFVLYGRYQDPELLTPSAIDTIQRIAYGFYITLVAAFGAIAIGIFRYHKGKVETKETTRADLSYVGEVTMDEVESISIHNSQSESKDIEKKLLQRKTS